MENVSPDHVLLLKNSKIKWYMPTNSRPTRSHQQISLGPKECARNHEMKLTSTRRRRVTLALKSTVNEESHRDYPAYYHGHMDFGSENHLQSLVGRLYDTSTITKLCDYKIA